MRNNLINFIFIFLFINITLLYSIDDDYSVIIRIEDYRWTPSGTEWKVDLYADLYYQGNLLQYSQDYTYDWYEKLTTDQEFTPRSVNVAHLRPDGKPNQYWNYYVEIFGPGFSIHSGSITIGRSGITKRVDLYGEREDGSSISENEMYTINVYTDPNWALSFGVPKIKGCYLSLNEIDTLWTTDMILDTPAEKFHHWKDDVNDIIKRFPRRLRRLESYSIFHG